MIETISNYIDYLNENILDLENRHDKISILTLILNSKLNLNFEPNDYYDSIC
jgi:hypothetical protein